MPAAISSNMTVLREVRASMCCRPYSCGLPAHIETIAFSPRYAPAQVNPVNAFEFGIEARRMLYLAVMRTLGRSNSTTRHECGR
jgi:hypothetical protein